MLNERIKQLRTSFNVSQVELAKCLGVTKQCVSNWENDNIQPSIEMLINLSNYFHVTTDYMLGLDDKEYIDVSKLSSKEIAHLKLIIEDLSKK